MAEFKMPSLGADMESATFVQWHVKPGDMVKRGDIVATVETAKGIIDIEIFDNGTIETLLAEPHADIAVGAPLAVYRPAAGEAPPTPESTVPPRVEPGAARPARARTVPESTAAPAAPPTPIERRRASPAARRRAAELGVDIGAVAPSSLGAAITLEDVERAAVSRAAGPADMRAVIAQAMSRSKREIPHYYLATTIDMRRALEWIEAWNGAHAVTERLLHGVLLIKAVARALEKVPELNGFWRDGRFDPGDAINVGTAIRLRAGGLVAPALPAANRESLPSLMRRFQDLVQRARSGKLRATELTSATITVSSLAEGSVEVLYPVIYPPQVAIVGFGAIVTRPWVADGAVAAAPLVTASLSADHRATDGQRGSAFLTEVARWLQLPEEL
jgi:pyruvate dehydrogenase E2 component (dihydrolipoamide acetyltransferase)